MVSEKNYLVVPRLFNFFIKMGSTREITLLLGTVCCLIIVCKHFITHTNAEPGQLHEEHREFQSVQRSSKIIGGIGSAG